MKNRLRKYLVAFNRINIILLILGCGWYVDYDEIRYLVMNPNIMNNTAWWNYYYYSGAVYYGNVKVGEEDEKKIATEWKKQLKLSSSEDEIHKFIFHHDSMSSTNYKNVQEELNKNKEWKVFMTWFGRILQQVRSLMVTFFIKMK